MFKTSRYLVNIVIYASKKLIVKSFSFYVIYLEYANNSSTKIYNSPLKN